VSTDYPKEMKEIHRKIGEPIAVKARGLARVLSGRMRGTIKSAPTTRAARVSAGQRTKYTGVQHWGWPAHNITPNPFLTEAVTELRDKTVADYQKLTNEFVERVWIDNF
jgi:hypothetical protein